MEQENNKNEADPTVDLARSEPSEKKSSNLSKAKSDVAKSVAMKFLKTRKANNTSEVQRKRQKKKNVSISEGSKAIENDVMKLNSMEENQQKDATTSVEHVEKNQQIQKNEENTSASGSKENNKDEADPTVDLARSEPSEKKSSNLSKAKSDVAKSVAMKFLKTRKANNTSEVQRKRQKKKNVSISEGSKAIENDVMKLNSMEENQQKDATTSVEHVEKNQQIQKNEENTSASGSKETITKSNYIPSKRRSDEEPGRSNKKSKNEEKRKGNKGGKRNEKTEKDSISMKNNTSDDNRDGKGTQQEPKQKGKIDGLIFMCNAKTKPDCFRYRVMGVSGGKKDLVLGIRPGVKLFLYDYDLKLLYGIYKASSSGAMKLEQKAFGGGFPAQVRFSVHADCFPLPESIFKKAIKENYDEKNKFKTELTARQVRKLTELFRPVPVQSTAPFHSPSRVAAHIIEHSGKREAHDRPREARPPSHRKASLRDYASHERDQRMAHRELASTKRENGHRDLYLSEKEYRSYGLLGERRNLSPQHHIAPALTSYLGNHREPPLRRPDTVYREPVPLQRDTIRSDPLYLTEREYRAYDLGATRVMHPTVSAATANTSVAGASILDPYITDPHYGRYSGDALVDAYLPRPREARLIETDLLRRESNQPDRLYSAHPSDTLIYHSQMYRHRDVKPAVASTSVSSQYPFGGPSLSYR